MKEDLRGKLILGAPLSPLPAGVFPIKVNLKLPSQLNLGLHQRINDQWAVNLGYEWTNWSILGTFPVVLTSGVGAGRTATRIAFNYRDGHFFSIGVEYNWDPNLTLRAGLGYDLSPVSDAVRDVRVPDNDRIWTTIGASYRISQKVALNFSYAHIFQTSTSVNITSLANPHYLGLPYVGKVKSSFDIVAVGLDFRWDEPAAPAPQAPIIRKF